jgi:twitching motility protein PilT
MAFDLEAALRRVIEVDGSDLHLKVPSRPLIRTMGHLEPIPATDELTPEDTEAAVRQLLKDPSKLEEFAQEHEVDFSFSLPGCSRFRVNAFRQRGVVSMVARAVPHEIKSIEQLGLPEVISEVADQERGIILVTGTTGSGKSSTLAAMIDQINRLHARHIVTIEDPIEFLHRDKRSILNQREVGADTASFKRALRRVLRQDPDVILVGEMRDEETVSTALSAAETGHLVLSTLHTVDAAETMGRMIEFFPEGKQQQIRSIMAGVLRGVVSQRLLPKVGGGRVAAVEVMVNNVRIADLIRENHIEEITEAIEDGSFFDMQSFTQALIAHVLEGTIDKEVAANAATNRHDFMVALDRALKQQSAEQRAEEERAAEEARRGSEAVEAGIPELRVVQSLEG